MTPDPYLRYQAYVLCAVIVVAAAIGQWPVSASATAVTALTWWPLHRNYVLRCREWVAPESEPAMVSRPRLDEMVRNVSLLTIALGIVVSLLSAGVGLRLHVSALASTAVAAVFISGGIFWSSLVDWYWVLPRVSGLLGHRSCRNRPEEGARTVAWEEVTRWWLAHRIASAVMVSVGVAGLLATLGGVVAKLAHFDPPAQAMVAALLLIVGAGVEIYRRHAAAGFPLAMHPEVRVGVAFKDKEIGPCWPVDVALEGFKLVSLSDHQQRLAGRIDPTQPRFDPAKGDTTASLEDAKSRRVGDGAYGCRGCTGINWYCIQNPDAWYKTVGAANERG